MIRFIRNYATKGVAPASPKYGGIRRKGIIEKKVEQPPPAQPPPDELGKEAGQPTVHRRSILGLAWFFVKIGLGLHIVCSYSYSLVSPWGASMLPTLYLSGEWVVISHFYRRGKNLEVGDIVSVKHPLFPGEGGIMKRIVGMPGDLVLAGTPGQSDLMVQVPAGHCWLSGDNLLWSRDSRIFGAVPLALVRGKVVARLFPWKERGWFRNPLEPLYEDTRPHL